MEDETMGDLSLSISKGIDGFWTAQLDVFDQDFDTAMAIWRVEDATVERLCVDEPPLTRRMRNTSSQSEFSQFSESSQLVSMSGRRKKRRRNNSSNIGHLDDDHDAPPPPLYGSSGSQFDTQETNVTQMLSLGEFGFPCRVREPVQVPVLNQPTSQETKKNQSNQVASRDALSSDSLDNTSSSLGDWNSAHRDSISASENFQRPDEEPDDGPCGQNLTDINGTKRSERIDCGLGRRALVSKKRSRDAKDEGSAQDDASTSQNEPSSAFTASKAPARMNKKPSRRFVPPTSLGAHGSAGVGTSSQAATVDKASQYSPSSDVSFLAGSGEIVRPRSETWRKSDASIYGDESGSKTRPLTKWASLQTPDAEGSAALSVMSSAFIESGFQSGRGQRVVISKDLLQQYTSLLTSDEDQPRVFADPGLRGGGCHGEDGFQSVRADATQPAVTVTDFQTGAGKAVAVSDAKMSQYAKSLLAADDGEEITTSGAGGISPSRHMDGFQVTSETTSASSQGEKPFPVRAPGFQTASGRSVKVSEERLREIERKLFGDDPPPAREISRNGSSPLETFLRPTTHASNSVMSDTTEEKKRDDGNKDDVIIDTFSNASAGRNGVNLVHSGFSTGSGANIRISQEKLQQYERKIRIEEEGSQMGEACGKQLDEAESAAAVVVAGFVTGSGRRVVVSKDKLREYEDKLTQIDGSDHVVSDERGERCLSHPSQSGGVVLAGFTTGSGRRVSISEAKLREYESKLTEDNDSGVPATTVAPLSQRHRSSPEGTAHGGFTRGSGRRVSFSEEHREKSVGEISEQGIVGNSSSQRSTKSSGVVLAGFMTGGGQQVSVSEDKIREYTEKLAADDDMLQLECVATPTRRVGDNRSEETRPMTEVGREDGVRDRETTAQQAVQKKARHSIGSASAPRGLVQPSRRHSLPPRPQPAQSSTTVVSGVSSGVIRRMGLVPQKTPIRPPVFKDVSNGQEASTRIIGAVRKWNGPRQSEDLSSNTGYTTPAKQRAPAPQSLSGKKGFRPPVPSKTPPSKALVTPTRPPQIKSDQGSQIQSHIKQESAAALHVPMPFREAMRISYKMLLAASEFDNFGLQLTARTAALQQIDAISALQVVFADNDVDFSLSEGDMMAVRESLVELFDGMKHRGYFGNAEKGLTLDWFRNHFRWIVCKLATMELQSPRFLLGRYLTKSQVLYQLCKRYQRDIVLAQRSILKKVLNRDANAASCMVLRVAAVVPFPIEEETNVDIIPPPYWKLAVVLTDGWYGMYAIPDPSLAASFWKLHKANRLVGMKIVTWGASLQNATDGLDPLECALASEPEWKNPLWAGKEDPSRWPYLKLPVNSTRPASADLRLGLEKLVPATAMSGHKSRQSDAPYDFVMLKSIPMRTLEVGGGIVRSIRVLVTRITPVLHLQPKEFSIGPRILCMEHMPHYFQARQQQMMMIQQAAEESGDDDDVAMAQPPLPVPFVKLEVTCSHPTQSTRHAKAYAVLTVWRPAEELIARLKEGDEYLVSSVSVSWKLDYGAQGVFLRLGTTKGSTLQHVSDDGDSSVTSSQNRGGGSCETIEAVATRYQSHVMTMPKEKKLVVDMCVLILRVDEGSQATRTGATTEIMSSVTTTNHVFVTDQSRRLMSIRLTSTRVRQVASSSSSVVGSKSIGVRSKAVEHVFRRGSQKLWSEGAVVCISGLEVSHFDEKLGLLDCELVESAQLISLPSKKSHFFDHAAQLRSLLSCRDDDGASAFSRDVQKLKKHVERKILLLDFELSQDDEGIDQDAFDSNSIGGVDDEADHLTQDLSAHPESDVNLWMSQAPLMSIEGYVLQLLPLTVETTRACFHGAVAIAYVKSVSNQDDDGAIHALYLPETVLQSTAIDFKLTDTAASESKSDQVVRFEAKWETSERLMNSWKSWERDGGASFLVATSVSLPSSAPTEDT